MKTIYLLIFALLAALGCGKGGGGTAPLSGDGNWVLKPGDSKSPRFKYRHTFLSLNKKGQAPAMGDERYSSWTVYRDPGRKKLNHARFGKGVRVVDIQAAKLVLGGEGSHSVYELIRKTNDVANLKIKAHTLVVQDVVHVAQAKVEISANKVIFKGGGKIITSPWSKSELPPAGHDGEAGLKAGDIFVNAAEMEVRASSPVLVARGGKGQAAGPGKHGARGVNAKVVAGGHYYYYYRSKCERYGGLEGGTRCQTDERKGWPSKNGQNAIRGGKPGAGGKGGRVFLSSSTIVDGGDLETLADVTGGLHGKPDILRRGGAPGRPARTCKNVQGKEKECRVAKKGSDARPFVISGERGPRGSAAKTLDQGADAEAFFFYHEYAKDLYLAGHRQKARRAFEKIAGETQKNSERSPRAAALAQASRAWLQKLDMRLDYFGHRKGWAPKLSFPAAARLFEREGRRNLKVYFLSRELSGALADLGRKKSAMRELKDELYWEIENARQNVTAAVRNSVNLSKSLGDLESAEEEFQLELARLEKLIREKAKRNLKIPFWRKSLELISAASKSVPVGQPSFGAAGAGLDMALKLFDGRYTSRSFFKEVPSVARKFKNFNWEAAVEELGEKLRKLDPKVLQNLSSNEAKLDYLKEVGAFAKPLAKAIKEQTALWKKREVSRDSLEREMDKIKKSHPVYRKVVEKLEALLAKKTEFRMLAEAFHGSLMDSMEKIRSNALAYAYAHDDLADLAGKFKADFKTSLKALENSSKRRLRGYAYTLARAYEYRYLEPFPGEPDLEAFYIKAARLLRQNAPREDIYAKLEELFGAEVSSLVEMIARQSRKRDVMAKKIDLNQAQLASLNRGESVFLNFSEPKFFGGLKENIRLLSVRLDESSVWSGEGEALFEHLGSGPVYKGEKAYFFTRSQEDVQKWISRAADAQLRHSSPSAEQGDALRALLGMEAQIEVFAKPQGRSFVKLSLSPGLKLKTASALLMYSFEHAR